MASVVARTLANGTRVYRVMYRHDGKQRNKTFEDENGANKWRRLLEAAGPEVAARALHVEAAATARTVAEQVEHHITHLTGVEDGTRSDYRAYLRNDIAGKLGAIPVTALTHDDVAAWVNGLQKRGLSGKSIKNRQSLLSAAMKSAMRDKLVPDNVAHGVKLPRTDTAEMVFLDIEEFEWLMQCTPEPWRALVKVLGATGLRFGEATALTVADVDFIAATIRVWQSWKHTDGQGYRLGPPKSTRAKRTVALPRACRRDLEHLTAGRSPGEFVFTNSRGGPVRHSTFHDSVWTPTVHAFAGDTVRKLPSVRGRRPVQWVEDGHGKRPRPHDLRHSFASWAIKAGHSLTAIQRTMGHESIVTTSDRYGHIARADRDAFAELLPMPELAALRP